MVNKIKNLVIDERGQGMTEYGLVLGVIGIGAIVALVALKDQISTLINNVKTNISSNTPSVSS